MNESIRRELDRQMRAQGMSAEEIKRVHAADPHAMAAARERLGGRMRAKAARPKVQVPSPTKASAEKVAAEKAKLAAMRAKLAEARAECCRKHRPWERVRWNDTGGAEPYDPQNDPFTFTCVTKAPPHSVSAACVVAGEERTMRRCVREDQEPPRSKWTAEEDAFLLAHTDKEASLWTGRSMSGVRKRRAKLEGRA